MLFRRKQSATVADEITPQRIAEVLLALFQSHGVKAALGDGWVSLGQGRAPGDAAPALNGVWVNFPDDGTKITATVVLVHRLPNAVSVQLDVYFNSPGDRVIIESLVGVGPSVHQAVGEAIGIFAETVLHVLLAVFFGQESDHVTRQTWTLNGIDRAVTVGNSWVRGQIAGESLPLEACLDCIRDTISTRSLSADSHWVRLYTAFSPPNAGTCEVLLDNVAWGAGQRRIAALSWPPATNFYSVRCFLIVARE